MSKWWQKTQGPPHTEIPLFRLSLTVVISGHRDVGSQRSYFTYHRSFRRSYPQTLGEDPGEVGGAGAVPQQLAVVELLEGLVTLALPLTLNPEDLQFRRGWEEKNNQANKPLPSCNSSEGRKKKVIQSAMYIDLLGKLIGMGFSVCNWLCRASKKEIAAITQYLLLITSLPFLLHFHEVLFF